MKTKYLSTIVAASFLTLAATPVLRAQESEADLRRDIEQLKQGQQQIQKQLQEIKRLVQARPAAAPAGPAAPNVAGKLFDLGNNPVKGASTAKLTLVEFTDYQ
jgi:protein-disulfide isomerase